MITSGNRPPMTSSLNESPSEKEGKFPEPAGLLAGLTRLNESPSEKEGKCARFGASTPSRLCLNESPSEKEGKSRNQVHDCQNCDASMKVPPKRKGN